MIVKHKILLIGLLISIVLTVLLTINYYLFSLINYLETIKYMCLTVAWFTIDAKNNDFYLSKPARYAMLMLSLPFSIWYGIKSRKIGCFKLFFKMLMYMLINIIIYIPSLIYLGITKN